jgi:dethiobiotin synthetase
MTKTFIISGTDTGIGKTVVSAMLTAALDANYWKPIQSGIEVDIEDSTDKKTVQRLTGLPAVRFLPERYVLTAPLSPHRSAELDNVTIDAPFLLPPSDRTLIVEGAGGLLVPLTRQKLQIDMFAAWQAPVILCARTGLGTINHTLLSVEALQQRKIRLHGIIFIGPDNADTIHTIAEFSSALVLGHIPPLDVIDAPTLLHVFNERFRREDFA